jgi:hypothetical protein
MDREYNQKYANYRSQAPFLFPLPAFLVRIISIPFKYILRKHKLQTRWDLLWVFLIYLGLVMVLSLPFVLLEWPPGGWMNWPFY